MITRSIVTVAVGKDYYLKLAVNLIRSFLLWHKNSDLRFLILTDNQAFFDEFSHQKQITIKILAISESDKSFTSKFLLIDHIVADENLFIDCDCLIYKPLDIVFNRMSAYDFTAIGKNEKEGNFFCDISKIIAHFRIESMPVFVGSVYFFKNNDTAKQIFSKAVDLKKSYDQLGFVRLRNKENEEPLFAISMALYHQQIIADDYTIKADLMHYEYYNTNVLKGLASVYKGKINKFDEKKPAIVHFNDKFSEEACYLMDQLRLSNVHKNTTLVEINGLVRYKLPEKLLRFSKAILRPLYHKILGPSKVKKNKR
ncbi:hypothetical protein OQX63_03815 [Pedobacter sp. PF22-3]|uniref:hypothetical protein n=1 Tax=Pedobacter sp. PF22-3 TaxID=2994467 RepID=UPI0022485B23|nr:hypothetical protein [Pedobacter sp. PF22-3]MCX2492584.1 hypothetical protein [Pedobacter sp. PF22-3]